MKHTQEPSGRSSRPRRWLSARTRVVLLWAVAMSPLLGWGLPSTRNDDLLFGGEPAWTAARFGVSDELERLRERNAGADTDLNPLPGRGEIVDLTADEAARAEILRRYRLYSRQPDEMITFRALQRMNPRAGDLDPKLYQYGGGYIYLIGAALGSAALTGLARITGDAGFYLQNPEAFARFYLVARLVSLVFGALTLVAAHKLARRAGGNAAAWVALVGVACCPVFVTAVTEAKPHLPSACMILWASLSALNYHARGRVRDAVWMGLQAGYAFGLVLTGALAALLWPALLCVAPRGQRGRAAAHLAIAGVIAIAVYVATNPYIPYNWLFNRGALTSNIANSTAMYAEQLQRAGAGLVRVAELLVEGAGGGLILFGLAGLGLLLHRHPRQTTIVAAAGLAMLVLCVLLGAGKPAEFARFLILPVILLAVAAGWSVAAIVRRRTAAGIVAAVAVLVMMRTPAYVRALVDDERGHAESRAAAGRWLATALTPIDTIGVLQEPAPYAVPPIDFAHRQVVLLPPTAPPTPGAATLPEWLVFTADGPDVRACDWWHSAYKLVAQFPSANTAHSPITWANKPVFILRRCR